jgi:hypothetical protein
MIYTKGGESGTENYRQGELRYSYTLKNEAFKYDGAGCKCLVGRSHSRGLADNFVNAVTRLYNGRRNTGRVETDSETDR